MKEDKQVRLRALEPEDVDVLYSWENDMSLWVVSDTLVPFSKDHLKKYIAASDLDIFQSKQLRLIIELVDSESESQCKAIGLIDMYDFDPYHNRAGLGILLHKEYRKKGHASEALKLFIDYCFNHLAIHQLYCAIAFDNESSIGLFKAKGFELVGVRKDWRKRGVEYIDEHLYQLINK